MKAAGLTDKVQIFIWDHNKERAIEHIDAFMADPEAASEISGFAYHWYSGDHFEALELLHGRYPDKVLMHSESCGLHIPGKTMMLDFSEAEIAAMPEGMQLQIRAMMGDKTANECDLEDANHYAHDIIGDLNHGMQRWIDWNMIVDRKGGPRHVPGGFAAPLVYEDDGTFTETISYAYLKTIAQAVKPDAVRIGKSVYGREVETCAVRNTDGTIGIVLLNQAEREVAVNIRISGQIIRDVKLPVQTLNTVVLKKD